MHGLDNFVVIDYNNYRDNSEIIFAKWPYIVVEG